MKPKQIVLDGLRIELKIPPAVRGLIIFAHGGENSGFSPRNQYVAETLNANGFGTLLCNLLTREEEMQDLFSATLRYDVHLLTSRLLKVTAWARQQPNLKHLKIGYMGARAAGAASVAAAAQHIHDVFAVVMKGGQVEFAQEHLKTVKAPTLLIVGEHDKLGAAAHQQVLPHLNKKSHLHTVQKADHFFSDKRSLEEVAAHAVYWFNKFSPY